MPPNDSNTAEVLAMMKDFRKRGFTLASYIANAGVMFGFQAVILLPQWVRVGEYLCVCVRLCVKGAGSCVLCVCMHMHVYVVL